MRGNAELQKACLNQARGCWCGLLGLGYEQRGVGSVCLTRKEKGAVVAANRNSLRLGQISSLGSRHLEKGLNRSPTPGNPPRLTPGRNEIGACSPCRLGKDEASLMGLES